MDNSRHTERYYHLAEKWKNKTITSDELTELESWYQNGQSNPIDIPDSFAKSEDELSRRLLASIRENAGIGEVPVRKLKSWGWARVAAAVAIFVLLGVGGFYLFNKKDVKESIAQTIAPLDDAVPGQYKAKLILHDGSELMLDSAAIGELVKQGNTRVVKQNGQVVYEGNTNDNTSKLLYNTIATANGQTYSLTLSDGSKVWLNAHSSIRFPVIFGSNERKVEITGEAYFEVAKHATKKFLVQANGTTTEVLGTHFNVNAYDDETDIKVTLLEGSVKVSNDVDAKIIKPGEQALTTHHSPLTINHSPDLEQVVAWKNGLFNFERSDLKSVMRQLSRWYDVEIQYAGAIPNEHFSGKINRNMNASKVLKVLEYSGVQFKIEDKKIIVYP